MGHFWVNEDASKIAPLGSTKSWGQKRGREFFFLWAVDRGLILEAKLVLDPAFMF